MTSAVLHGYFYFIVLPGTNGCVNSRVNSPENGPVGLKHVEIRQYMNKIEIVTSVGFYSISPNRVPYIRKDYNRQTQHLSCLKPIICALGRTFSVKCSGSEVLSAEGTLQADVNSAEPTNKFHH